MIIKKQDIDGTLEVTNHYYRGVKVMRFLPTETECTNMRYGIRHIGKHRIVWYNDEESCMNVANALLNDRIDDFEIIIEKTIQSLLKYPEIYPYSPLFDREDREFLKPKHGWIISDDLPF